MFELKNLKVSVEDQDVLQGINLKVNKGEVHALMGPNGSGKSSMVKALVGHPSYEITSGEALFEGESLLGLDPDLIALKGLFMAFQYPVEIPGVNNASFLRMAYNAKQKSLGKEEIDPLEFEDILAEKLKLVGLSEKLLERSVNHGFSGGEKKRNEILQMALLEPKLAILDETDSGLDIDALREVAEAVNKLKTPENATIIITHYQRLLNYITPDFVHVIANGKIVRSGDKSLALELEEKGYDWILKPVTKT